MKNYLSRTTAILLSGIMAFGSFSINVSAQPTTFSKDKSLLDTKEASETKADYVDGEVLVMYSATEKSPFSTYSLAKSGLTDDINVEQTFTFPNSSSASTYSTASTSSDTKIACVSSKSHSTDELVTSFSKLANVTAVEPNYIYQTTSLQNTTLDNFSGSLWGLDNKGQNGGTPDGSVSFNTDINSNSVASEEKTDESAPVIAILDTGVDYTNSTLASHMWTNPYQGSLAGVNGYNFLYDGEEYTSTTPMDDHGHGTHCAGIINSVMNGYGEDVKIMALKWLDSNGSGDLSDVISAYAYIYSAQRLGVNVVAANNSWGGDGSSKILNSVIDIVGQKGCISVFAAGNSSENNDTIDTSSNLESEYAIVVSASNEDGELTSFSSYGAENVDFAAPGADILSTVSYNSFNPTIYDATQKTELCSSFNDYNFNSYEALVEDAKNTQSSYSFTNIETPDQTSDVTNSTIYSTVPFSTNSNVTLSTDDDTYFGQTGDNSDSSLKISVDGKKDSSYRVVIPYTLDASTCYENISTMIRYESPNVTSDSDSSESISGILSLYDCPVSGLNVKSISDFDKLSGSSLDNMLLGGIGMNGDTNYWSHLEVANNATLKSDTQFLMLELYCAVDGSYSIYLDDFGISKENKDVSLVSDYGHYDFYNGTSMACPYAVGAIGLLSILEEFQSATPLQKANILKSSTTKNPSLSGKVSTGGLLDISKYLNSGYSANPVISSVSVSGKNAIIKGANLNNCAITINGKSCTGTVNTNATELTVPATDYINKYVKITLTKNDASVSKIAYLVKGKKSYSEFANTFLGGGSITAMTSTGNGMYFVSNNVLYSYDPNVNVPEQVSEVAQSASKKPTVLFTEIQAPNISMFTDASFDSDVWGDYQLSYSDQLVYLDEKIYTILNVTQNTNLGAVIYSKKYLVQYDITNGTWSSIKELNGNLSNQTICAFNGILYLIGGFDYNTSSFSTAVTKYNPATGKWSNGVSLPEGRCGGKAIQSGNSLIYTLAYTSSQPVSIGGLPAALAQPKTLIFNGTNWKTSTASLKAYNYESTTLKGQTYYYADSSLGICKNGVVFTGISCEGYGDSFTYTPSTDKYTAGSYTGILDLNKDYFCGTTLGSTMYGFYFDGESDAMSMKTMPVSSGLVEVASTFTNGIIETEQPYYLPGAIITCNVTPDEGYYIKDMKLKDADGHIATVTNGKAEIRATSNVTVASKTIGKYVTKIALNKKNITYLYRKSDSNHTYSLKATVSPKSTASYPVNTNLTWKSSNTKYATVSSSGKVTILKKGIGKKVKITATAKDGSGINASCTIKICNPVSKIKISGKSTSLSAGKTMKLTATVTPSTATVKDVKWKSSNKKYATVTSNGKVVAKKAGIGKKVTITATAKDGSKIKSTYKIKIKK